MEWWTVHVYSDGVVQETLRVQLPDYAFAFLGVNTLKPMDRVEFVKDHSVLGVGELTVAHVDASVSAVPLPSSVVLFVAALVLGFMVGRKRG